VDTPPRRDALNAHPSEEIRVLDTKGCLTLEVMCFSDELPSEQHAVVERHIRTCSICAQQQTALATATERFRRVRPRLPLPAELKVLARQLALRSITQRQRSTAEPRHGEPRHAWYQSRTFWVVTLAGMALAIIIAVVAAILAA
jgi:anti-sigma factor RsiW